MTEQKTELTVAQAKAEARKAQTDHDALKAKLVAKRAATRKEHSKAVAASAKVLRKATDVLGKLLAKAELAKPSKPDEEA